MTFKSHNLGLSAIPDIPVVEDAKQFMTHLGYPVYFIPLMGVTKLLGSIAILIPGFKKIKEWAYAGLVFHLIGAVYSVVAVDGFQLPMLTMVVVFAVAFTSYGYNQKYYVSHTS